MSAENIAYLLLGIVVGGIILSTLIYHLYGKRKSKHLISKDEDERLEELKKTK